VVEGFIIRLYRSKTLGINPYLKTFLSLCAANTTPKEKPKVAHIAKTNPRNNPKIIPKKAKRKLIIT